LINSKKPIAKKKGWYVDGGHRLRPLLREEPNTIRSIWNFSRDVIKVGLKKRVGLGNGPSRWLNSAGTQCTGAGR